MKNGQIIKKLHNSNDVLKMVKLVNQFRKLEIKTETMEVKTLESVHTLRLTRNQNP